jgi:hypothetical protein
MLVPLSFLFVSYATSASRRIYLDAILRDETTFKCLSLLISSPNCLQDLLDLCDLLLGKSGRFRVSMMVRVMFVQLPLAFRRESRAELVPDQLEGFLSTIMMFVWWVWRRGRKELVKLLHLTLGLVVEGCGCVDQSLNRMGQARRVEGAF